MTALKDRMNPWRHDSLGALNFVVASVTTQRLGIAKSVLLELALCVLIGVLTSLWLRYFQGVDPIRPLQRLELASIMILALALMRAFFFVVRHAVFAFSKYSSSHAKLQALVAALAFVCYLLLAFFVPGWVLVQVVPDYESVFVGVRTTVLAAAASQIMVAYVVFLKQISESTGNLEVLRAN